LHYVRIKVEEAEGGAVEYHAALNLADRIARQNPGLMIEVTEDKVWATFRSKEDNGGSEEVQE
jgi:hypothetical protein